ncbi:hypothetical protein GGI07_002861 [Coemansia sp. Benny D115]|nr:hypothetical protein GGI07_002861 [Coemansia sp. Benny D115]
MSSAHNMVCEPGEDEHYEVRELGHPNKAHRKMHTMPPTAYVRPRSGSDSLSSTTHMIGIGSSNAVPLSPATTMDITSSSNNGVSSTTAMALPEAGSGDVIPMSMLEQVRLSKAKAIEILHNLDADSQLELDISQYLRDVDASYDEMDPKLMFPKLRATWTAEEDRLLRVGVRVYGPNTESWPRIAMLVPGRTNKSCRKRWFHSLDPTLHKGPWTAEEDALLRDRVTQYPSQWSRVAEGIPGRTDDQCAKRWRESLDPEIDRGKWRPEEDRLLLEKFSEYGTQWQKIATFFQGRPGLHCRNRWRKIQRIISQKEKKSGPIAANDMTSTLASVTESVNKRKTAQRTRLPALTASAAATEASGKALRSKQPDMMDIVADPAMDPDSSSTAESPISANAPSLSALARGARQAKLSLKDQRKSQVFEQLVPNSAFVGSSPLSNSVEAVNIALSSIIESMASSASSNNNNNPGSLSATQKSVVEGIGAATATPPRLQVRHTFHTPASVLSHHQALAPARVLNVADDLPVEAMGALYMPTSDTSSLNHQQHQSMSAVSSAEGSLRAIASLRQQQHKQQAVSGGAKRTNSVLFSPSEEQRQRLRALGRKLYGCAANPKACNAAFADSLSLNSHLKLAHPDIAYLIPSLNTGSSGTSSPAIASPSTPTPTGCSAPTTAVAVGKGALLKPYRCAMDGCNHAYKNVNGLEYHIFQSRKSNHHLMLNTSLAEGARRPHTADKSSGAHGTASDIGGGQQDVVMGASAGSLGIMDEAGDINYAPSAASTPSGITSATTAAAAGSLPDSVDMGSLLQCTEVECLATFNTERELRQHVAAMHPRPIRRATKPSNRAYKNSRLVDTRSLSPQMVGSPSGGNAGGAAGYWSSPVALSDVLGTAIDTSDPKAAAAGGGGNSSNNDNAMVNAQLQAAAAVVGGGGGGDQGMGTMPTIPEGDVAKITSSATAAAVIAAAMGYNAAAAAAVAAAEHGGGLTLTPGVGVSSGGRPLSTVNSDARSPGPHLNLPQHMMLPRVNHAASTMAGSAHFFPTSESPFMSAPALISATGGEPTNISSYFSLNMAADNDSAATPSHRQHYHALTPALVGAAQQMVAPMNHPHSHHQHQNYGSHTLGTAADDHTSMVLEAINQAVVANAQAMADGNVHAESVVGMHDESGSDLLSGEPGLSGGPKFMSDIGPVDTLPLDVHMMQNILNPFYSSTPPSSGADIYTGARINAPDIGTDGDAMMVDGEDAQSTFGRAGSSHYPRSHRSDSVDLTSLATVPTPTSNAGATHVATTPGSAGLLIGGGDMTAESPQSAALMSPPAVSIVGNGSSGGASKSGTHSQMAAALMSKRNRQQQQQQQQQQMSSSPGQPSLPSNNQMQISLPPWSQDLSALGLLPFPNTNGNSSDGTGGQHNQNMRYSPASSYDHDILQKLYSPQATDLAQFHRNMQQQILQHPGTSTAASGPTGGNNSSNVPRYQRQFASSMQLLAQKQKRNSGSNSVTQCPVVTCSQGFSDANALKHHLDFDHTREDRATINSIGSGGRGGGNSIPGSPMENGSVTPGPFNLNLASQSPLSLGGPASAAMGHSPYQQQLQQQNLMLHMAASTPSASAAIAAAAAAASPMPAHLGAGVHVTSRANTGDVMADHRTKTPHWVDPDLWSMWIAAANGQGDSITAAAAATAMGITPGVVGPTTFLSSNAVSTGPLSAPLHGFTHYQHPTDNELLRMFDSVNRNSNNNNSGGGVAGIVATSHPESQ